MVPARLDQVARSDGGKSTRFGVLRVPLGRVAVTRGAVAQVSAIDLVTALRRHACGDWGEVDADDRRANDLAVHGGGRVLSAYSTGGGVRFWIITEADRSVTIALLPGEY